MDQRMDEKKYEGVGEILYLTMHAKEKKRFVKVFHNEKVMSTNFSLELSLSICRSQRLLV